MTRTFITRRQILAAALAALALLAVAGLVTPASAEAATQGRCSVTRAAAGDPASFRVTCDAVRPAPARTLGTAITRRGKTCTIAHVGRSTPRRSVLSADAAAGAAIAKARRPAGLRRATASDTRPQVRPPGSDRVAAGAGGGRRMR